MNKTRTTTGLDWNVMHGLLVRLKNDEKRRERLLIATGCYLGLRASDLLNLTWGDVINKGEIIIQEKKTKKLRVITINSFLKHLLINEADELKINGQFDIDAFLFSNKNGNKLTIQHVNRILKKIFIDYRVITANASTHALRKTFGKRVWEMDGKSERALIYLSQIFNHTSTQITRRYIGIVQEDIDNIYLNL